MIKWNFVSEISSAHWRHLEDDNLLPSIHTSVNSFDNQSITDQMANFSDPVEFALVFQATIYQFNEIF